MLIVSIHARVRAGDMRLFLHRDLVLTFQSTPACERATVRGKAAPHLRCFNPRPRASGRPDPKAHCGARAVSIHARVRAGDDCPYVAWSPYIDVSIHARVRAGDPDKHIRHQHGDVSIHARVRAGDHAAR